MRRVAVAALVAMVELAASLDAMAQWREVRTANFLFAGDARDADIRRLAATLEQFRATLTALPGSDSRSPVPTIVLVFGSDRSFAPYRPRFEGRAVEATGFFLGGVEVNYIAIDAASEARAVRAVLHEYAHFLIAQAVGSVPLWVAEGMAQFYESFQLLDGRSAAIGAPLVEHVALLRRATLMPLEELMAVDVTSSTYHEGDRRGLFYAQSWALVHYLTVGNPARTAQMRAFLAGVAAGVPGPEAFAAAFGASAAMIEGELQAYVRQREFRGIRVGLQDRVEAAIPERGERLADIEVQAYLGDLLVRQGRGAEARARLEPLLRTSPDHPRATAALADLDLREGLAEDAILRLQRAGERHPDSGLVQAALGRAWLEQLRHEDNTARRRGALQEARAALARADALEPDVVHTRALLGFAEAAVGDLAHGIALLTDAVQRAPARAQYRLMLADALVRHGRYEEAAAHLAMLAARGSDAGVRLEADAMLDRLDAQRRARDAVRPVTVD